MSGYLGTRGKSNRHTVYTLLAERPGLTTQEIADASGLRVTQVHSTLYSYRKTDFVRVGDLWYLHGSEPKKLPLTGSIKSKLATLLRADQPRSLAELVFAANESIRDTYLALLGTEFEKIDSLYWLNKPAKHDPMLSDVPGQEMRKTWRPSGS